MKNIREWKLPWKMYISIVAIVFLPGSILTYMDRDATTADTKNERLQAFEQMLVGQKETRSISDPYIRQFAEDLVESQYSTNVETVRKAEERVFETLKAYEIAEMANRVDLQKYLEISYANENITTVRKLAQRGPGSEKMVRNFTPIVPTRPWLVPMTKRLAILEILLMAVPFLFYGLKGILRLKDKRRLRHLENKISPEYAARKKGYRVPGLEDEMTPASLQKAENAGLVQTEPGEVQELATLQEALAPGKASQST